MENFSEYLSFVKRYYILGVLLFGMILCVNCHENVAFKRDASVPTSNTENVETDYEEYPMVVPKRTAMFLDRLMVALHNALEDNDKEGLDRLVSLYRNNYRPSYNEIPRYDREMVQHLKAGRENQLGIFEIPVLDGVNPNGYIERHPTGESVNIFIPYNYISAELMELQRRGNDDGLGANKGRKYWRCYFNAVTCF